LTFNAGASAISFSNGATVARTFNGGGLTYATVNWGGGGVWNITGANTFATFAIPPATVGFQLIQGTTQTITNFSGGLGSSSQLIDFKSASVGSQATVSSSNNASLSWAVFRDLAFTGGGTFTATNSLNMADNSGITITAPSTGGGGGSHIIGGGL
jgi:hypothetical protein